MKPSYNLFATLVSYFFVNSFIDYILKIRALMKHILKNSQQTFTINLNTYIYPPIE